MTRSSRRAAAASGSASVSYIIIPVYIINNIYEYILCYVVFFSVGITIHIHIFADLYRYIFFATHMHRQHHTSFLSFRKMTTLKLLEDLAVDQHVPVPRRYSLLTLPSKRVMIGNGGGMVVTMMMAVRVRGVNRTNHPMRRFPSVASPPDLMPSGVG